MTTKFYHNSTTGEICKSPTAPQGTWKEIPQDEYARLERVSREVVKREILFQKAGFEY